jgi:alkanesulfonate monooxygenase SsuD/methylene tetrahydromethanopterin reductase-like flavin-dependent oxidoreductase (luciferase family)
MRFGIFDWVEASDSLAPAEVYAHKLRLAAAADRAGLHGIFLAEHQGTPLSIDGSPSVLLSAIFQRTQRLRAGALTWCLPWYDPYRFYNEICMLDQLSGGRLELGVGRGVSPIESRIFGLANIEQSRERYRETLDVFFAACGSAVLNFRGRHHAYHDVELLNRPVQRPYPPLWFPSSNRESIAFTARHGYHTALMAKTGESRALFDEYRELWDRHRQDAGRHNAHVAEPFLAKTQHIVIAENGAEAERLGVQAYESWADHIHHLNRREARPETLTLDPFSEDSLQRLIAGTPQTVAERLREVIDATGLNYLLCIVSFGSLAPQAAVRSLELFVTEVMPTLQA